MRQKKAPGAAKKRNEMLISHGRPIRKCESNGVEDEFEIFDEYTDRYTAEDAAKDLVTKGQAVEAEVIRVGR
jgi:hypothetical protein